MTQPSFVIGVAGWGCYACPLTDGFPDQAEEGGAPLSAEGIGRLELERKATVRIVDV